MTSTAASSSAALAYHEPDILIILIQSSFLLLLNVVSYVLDRVVYCGLLGQVLLGIAWGTPGAKWLHADAEQLIVQLGYLGLILVVYQGGLSTSFASLRANIFTSFGVAITGISFPIALSFILGPLTGATPVQCFAAGAALCSTSLGTTFTVLAASGLSRTRLGVVLSSAAMMDDVIGLVLVQVISNIGSRSTSSSAQGHITAATVVRPLLVSLAFTVLAPAVCVFIAKPLTFRLNAVTLRENSWLNRVSCKRETALVVHTFILIGCVSGASYAGTSNLFAAYIAGAAISWWDSDVSHRTAREDASANPEVFDGTHDQSSTTAAADPPRDAPLQPKPSQTGTAVYEAYYAAPVDRILKPFFFASIGFSIPITDMFSREIVWKGIVYTLLMTIGKLACGLWLVRLSTDTAISLLPSHLRSLFNTLRVPHLNYICGSSRVPKINTPSQANTSTSATTSAPAPVLPKPHSLYPASIIGCAMTARGEIGFLISSIAENNRVFSTSSTAGGPNAPASSIFLIVTWAIVLCTTFGPLAVGLLVHRVKRLQRCAEKDGRSIQPHVLGEWGVS